MPYRRRLALASLAAALLAGGCGQSVQTPLPELSATPEKPVVAEQKKAAIKGMEELAQKASASQAEALKEIERTR
jgi:hypothetical protein